MQYIIGGITVLIIGLIAGYFIGSSRLRSNDKEAKNFSNEAEKIKGLNIAKLKDYLSKETDGKINNEDVRKLLDVSDATACRYLNDLEKEGLVTQIGTDGPKVYYEIKNKSPR